MVYCDYTASGRCLIFVERYLQTLQRSYANTHTEDDVTGRSMSRLLHEAEAMVKRAVNAGPGGRIVACGTSFHAALVAKYFIEQICRLHNLKSMTIGEDAIAVLQAQDWPGNARQLRNSIERLLIREPRQIIEGTTHHLCGNSMIHRLQSHTAVHRDNTTTGALYYDADGTGAGAAVQFAQLNGTPILTVNDFLII